MLRATADLFNSLFKALLTILRNDQLIFPFYPYFHSAVASKREGKDNLFASFYFCSFNGLRNSTNNIVSGI